jgi:hypothetical protein
MGMCVSKTVRNTQIHVKNSLQVRATGKRFFFLLSPASVLNACARKSPSSHYKTRSPTDPALRPALPHPLPPRPNCR